MKKKSNSILGILLILFGGVAFLDYFVEITAWGWVGILVGAGFLALVILWPDRSNWINLLPTYILWVIAGMIALILLRLLRNETIATYVMAAIATPFLIGYYRNRTLWGLLIPAYVLLVVGLMVAMIGLGWLVDLVIPAYVMFAIAVPFLVVYLRNRSNWWALIPSGIMGVIGLSFLLATPAARLLVPTILMVIGVWIIVRQLTKKGS